MGFGSLIRRASSPFGGIGAAAKLLGGGGRRRPAGARGGPGGIAAMLKMGKPGQSPTAIEPAPVSGAGGFQQLAEPAPVSVPEPGVGGGGVPNPFMGPEIKKQRPWIGQMMGGGGF